MRDSLKTLWISIMWLLDTAMFFWYLYYLWAFFLESPFLAIIAGWFLTPFFMLFDYPWIVIPYIILMELTIRIKI